MTKLQLKEQLFEANNDRVISNLTKYTNARIAIGHSGGHTLTKNWLEFQLDFAQAKDAVLSDIDLVKLAHDLTELDELSKGQTKLYTASSCANSLDEFLTRPDLGRALSTASQAELSEALINHPSDLNQDILIVISSGLSSAAIENQAVGFLGELLPLLNEFGWNLAPIILSKRTRVAFADKVNAVFKAKVVINLIGERPGLSSNDSMSVYFTYGSKIDSTDEQRNCISNIHQNGLSHRQAAQKVAYLVHKAFDLGYSGVSLKDDFSQDLLNQALKGISHDA
ncbi:MAG: ethanolamine ammonia-lyase subunit EutC [Burkholderiales bacterium]|nr:ethanolamine ammonia-lyase subunit EutC [Burkholderiales bacterium]